MKFLLSMLMLLPVTLNYSQEMKLTVSARNESITVAADDDNNDKIFVIKSAAANSGKDYLIVKVFNEETATDWKRSFTLYDSSSNEIASLKLMRKYEYCADLKSILPKLEKNKNYFLYTVALPTDPQKAMLVKPARRLVCKIKLGE